MSNLMKLKALAEAASPGPWLSENDDLFWRDDGYTKHLMETYEGSDLCNEAEHPANLRFIAAANPATVLELIAEVEELREHKQHLVELRETHGFDSWSGVLVRVDQLKAENEALRKVISECATSCGAAVSVECSLEFMQQLPAEISSVVFGLRPA